MDASLFLSLPQGLCVTQIIVDDGQLIIEVVSTHPCASCPLCGSISTQIHSHYQRKLRDVPCGGQSVIQHLSVRKFFCRNRCCPRKIFTERLPSFLEPWARMTIRLSHALLAIGRATSGEVGARLATRLALQTSPTTLLRRLMALPTNTSGPVPILGIDDFSFRRGRKFGTILVDLKHHKVIDVLPDRCAETSAAWMSLHPEIEIVSRDRGENYAAAARKGAPQARQVADRFHLTQNLGNVLEAVLDRNKASLRLMDDASGTDPGQALSPSPQEIRPPPNKKAEQTRLAHRAARQEHYEQAVALREQGFTLAVIAHRVGVSRRTLNRWLSAPSFPERRRRRAERTKLEDFHSYLQERWQAGVQNATHLFQEIRGMGYTGCYMSVYLYLTCLRTGVCLPATPVQPAIRSITSWQAAFLFLRFPANLKPEEKLDLEKILAQSSDLTTLYQLVQRFQQMIHHQGVDLLDNWMECALACPYPELHRFVTGLRQDYDAVKAAFISDYNNGMVEGHVNRLKLLKRLGYGRAGFPLLRQRVLHAL